MSTAPAPPLTTSPLPLAPDAPPSRLLAQISPRTWLHAALLTLLLLALYHHIALKLVQDWIQFPDDAQGLIVPFFVAWVLWENRRPLAATPIRSTWAGLPLIVFALFILLVGIFGADLFLSRLSFLLLTAGLLWTLLGVPMLRRLKFSLFLLFLAIPLPAVLLNHLTFPLQLLASRVASMLLPLAGVPVLREGNVIQLPAMQLEVAEACSGIRSLMSLFTVAVIFGYFVERSTFRRTLFALSALPIAVAANAARIVGTGLCVQYWDPDKALGFFHEFSGWLIFVVSLLCLYFVHTLMRLWPEKGAPTA